MKQTIALSNSQMKLVQGGGIFDFYWVPVYGPIWKKSDELDKEMERLHKKRGVDAAQRVLNKKSLNVSRQPQCFIGFIMKFKIWK